MYMLARSVEMGHLMADSPAAGRASAMIGRSPDAAPVRSTVGPSAPLGTEGEGEYLGETGPLSQGVQEAG
jgi:hypothetical protein